jgi:hypothetical protein
MPSPVLIQRFFVHKGRCNILLWNLGTQAFTSRAWSRYVFEIFNHSHEHFAGLVLTILKRLPPSHFMRLPSLVNSVWSFKSFVSINICHWERVDVCRDEGCCSGVCHRRFTPYTVWIRHGLVRYGASGWSSALTEGNHWPRAVSFPSGRTHAYIRNRLSGRHS